MNPFLLFEKWFANEKELSNLNFPAACCLSTEGLDGYPNARFVSLKEIVNESFVITGPLNSRKAREIKNNPKAALSFWWTSSERQVRIQGDAIEIPEIEAEVYFDRRNSDSKIVSEAFQQGNIINSLEALRKHFDEQKKKFEKKDIKRPEHWGGFFIKPIRIEFMEFKESRLHERTLYQWLNNEWEIKILQP